MQDQDIMNMTEAAEFLGITRQTLSLWLKTGKDVPHRRVSEKKVFFTRSALREWTSGK